MLLYRKREMESNNGEKRIPWQQNLYHAKAVTRQENEPDDEQEDGK